MKKVILPFICVAALLGACNSQNANTASANDSTLTDSSKAVASKEAPKAEETPAPEKVKKDIAFEVYNAIPKAELPKDFSKITRGDNGKIDVTIQPDYVAASYEEGECSHYFFYLFCKPITGTNNYMVYWWKGAGCDGSELLDKEAYVYSGGKLNSVTFDLPTPPMSDFLSKENEAKANPNDLKGIKKDLSQRYLYDVEEDTLRVMINTCDYFDLDELLTYPCYVWNGREFVKK